MDFRGQPEILNAEDYGLSGTEPVINQECMLVHEKSGHYVKLSGTAIIDNITASNSLFEAVFFVCAPWARSNGCKSRTCPGSGKCIAEQQGCLL